MSQLKDSQAEGENSPLFRLFCSIQGFSGLDEAHLR